MATLNIKDFPDPLYRKLKAHARREHRSIAQQVIHLLTEDLVRRRPVSILGLKGLGKEAWSGVDAVGHVERERAAWD